MRVKRVAFGLAMAAFLSVSPLAVASALAEDCVRTVRAISDFEIRGDAWQWWARAADYAHQRDDTPMAGSVLVFKRSGRLGRGHVSLVSRLVDSRTIEVDHSWLDGKGLRRHMRVVDVSLRNDWSAVRVWHEPSGSLGARVYPTYGFILPAGQRPRDGVQVADAGRVEVAPRGRASLRRHAVVAVAESVERRDGLALVSVPSERAARALAVSAKPRSTVAVLPRRKPAQPQVIPPRPPQRHAQAPVPERKPGAAAPRLVASLDR